MNDVHLKLMEPSVVPFRSGLNAHFVTTDGAVDQRKIRR